MADIIDVNDLSDALSGTILSIAADRLGAVAESAVGTGLLRDLTALRAAFPPKQSASILLTLQRSMPQPTATVRPAGPGTAGNPSTTQQQANKDVVIAQLTLDITPDQDGFAQSISDTRTSRETIHQTAGGYTVDQWGMAPGSFSIDVIVALRGSSADERQAEILKFKSLLQQAKAVDPLSVDTAQTLTYHNTVDGESLILSQSSLDVKQSARDPNLLQVSIRGSILYDYNFAPQMQRSVRRQASSSDRGPVDAQAQLSTYNGP